MDTKDISKYILSINTNIYCDKSSREIFDEAREFNNNNQIELSEDYIKRIIVNHIRHKYTLYDNDVKKINKFARHTKITNNSIYKQYKNRILYSISISYPFLKQECMNQISNMDMVRYI
jgi:hypothetical protein